MSDREMKALVKDLTKRRQKAVRVRRAVRGNLLGASISTISALTGLSSHKRAAQKFLDIYDLDLIEAHVAGDADMERAVTELREKSRAFFAGPIESGMTMPSLATAAWRRSGNFLIDACEDLYMRAVKDGFVG